MNNSGFGHMRFFCELRLERNGKRNWSFSRTLLFMAHMAYKGSAITFICCQSGQEKYRENKIIESSIHKIQHTSFLWLRQNTSVELMFP